MKYIIDLGTGFQKIEVPEGAEARYEITTLMNEGKETAGPILKFYDGDKLLAVFLGVKHFYPKTMEPKTKTWADED